MKCALCNKPIDQYNPAVHHLALDEHNAADICPTCIDAFTEWQKAKYAKLFPTTRLKKIYGNMKR